MWPHLWRRLRVLFRPRQTERELADELSFHLERAAAEKIASGVRPDDARAAALRQFGSPTLAADRCRDLRATAALDVCLRDVGDACRSIRRAPGTALTIVGTIALSLVLLSAAFAVFSALTLRPDAVRDADSLFAVARGSSKDGGVRPPLTRTDYAALVEESGIFASAFARMPDITTRVDGQMMEGQLVTGNFFAVLGVPAALGRTLTPKDDEPGGGHAVLVLSHRGWTRLFGGDPAVVGRGLVINGARYEIIGVAAEGFRGLSLLPPDYWAPLSGLAQFRPWAAGEESRFVLDIVGRLAPGVSRRAAEMRLDAWGQTRAATMPAGGGERTALALRKAAVPMAWSSALLLAVSPLFVAFALVLLIGCANVGNLLLARGVARQREIGVRLALGASRRRVVRQLLAESVLLAVAGAGCAFLLGRAALQMATSGLARTMPPELAELFHPTVPPFDWRVALFLVITALLSVLAFGLLPALHATRLDPVRGLRGEVLRNVPPRRARHALLLVQVTTSALLLVCAGVFLRTAVRAAAFDPGWQLADNILIDIVNEPLRPALLAAVSEEPSVRAVAAAWPELLNEPRAAVVTPNATHDDPVQAGHGAPLTTGYRLVSSAYFDVLGMNITHGRAFSDVETRDRHAVAVISARAAAALFPSDDPLGPLGRLIRVRPDPTSHTRVRDEPQLPAAQFTVVGIARDVPGFRLTGYSEAEVYLPASTSTAETMLLARVGDDAERARRALLQRLTIVDPNVGMVIAMRSLGRIETYPFQVAFFVAVVLGGLALTLTMSGVFGVVAYLVGQRRRELAVRTALGARKHQMVALAMRESLQVVGVGLVAGGGSAVLVGALLASLPATAKLASVVAVFDPWAYVLSLSVIAGTCALAAAVPACAAARTDVRMTLQQE